MIRNQSIEIIAPFPLENCLTRLEKRAQQGTGFLEAWLFSHRIIFRHAAKSSEKHSFSLSKQSGRLLKVTVIGELRRRDSQSTFVSVQGRIARSTYLLVGGLSLPHLIFWPSFGLYKPAIVVGIIDVVIFAMCFFARASLLQTVYSGLKGK